MSIDATRWAWKVTIPNGTCLKSNKRLVLLSFADRAGEEHTAYPSAKRLKDDTCLDRKTILAVIIELIKDGLITDTGERKGTTKQVRVFKLIGVDGRETIPTTEPFQPRNRSANGTDNDPNDGTDNDPNDGIRNLPLNLSMNLSCQHEWIPNQDQLISVIKQAGQERNLKLIFELPNFEFELGAFNAHHSGRVLGEGKKLYSFATWIVDKFEQYQKRNPDYVKNITDQPEIQNIQPLINLPSKPKGFLGGAQ